MGIVFLQLALTTLLGAAPGPVVPGPALLGVGKLASTYDQATCATIHGALPAAFREEERMRFQRGDAKVVLFTVEEGISLHQGENSATSGSASPVSQGANDVPRSEVIHDLRWSAIQMECRSRDLAM